MYNKRLLKSESGSIVLSALAVAALVGIFSAVIATQIKSTNDISQLPRIRAAMAQVELQARLAAFSSASYSCEYKPPVPPATEEKYECKLLQDEFNKLKTSIDGGSVEVDGLALDPTENHLRFAIIFKRDSDATQKHFSIAPRVLDLEIPSELLQPITYSCPDNKPIFAGYFQDNLNGHVKGKADCREVPTVNCGAGRYVASIDPLTLKPECADAGGTYSCPAGQYFSEFSWNNGGTVTKQCASRKDPFTEMGFDYNSSTTFDNNYVSRDPDTPDPQPGRLPDPEVITWSSPNPQPASSCYVPPRVDCAGSFGACSQTCGGGSQTYIISQPASGGGAACPFNNGAVQQCNTQACPTNPNPPTGGNCSWVRVADTGHEFWFQNFVQHLEKGGFYAFLKHVTGPIPEAGACTILGEETACDGYSVVPNEGICFQRAFAPNPIPGPIGPVGATSSIPGCSASNNGERKPGIWGNTCTGGNLRDGSTWECQCPSTPTNPTNPNPTCPSGSSSTGAGASTNVAGCKCNNAGDQWHTDANMCYGANECVLGSPMAWRQAQHGCVEYFLAAGPNAQFTYRKYNKNQSYQTPSRYCSANAPCWGYLTFHCNNAGAVVYDNQQCMAGQEP